MNIWFDLTNSPHVPFFANLISELGRQYNIIITCRDLSNTIELIEINKYPYHVVGKHYGKNSFAKICGYIHRVFQLYFFLKRKNIHVAISHSSFYSPLVSKLLGSKCLYLNDNEYAVGNRISFRFADIILIPEFLERDSVSKKKSITQKIINYPGLKEGVYLWNTPEEIFQKSLKANDTDKKTIFIRPEPWTAQYYKAEKNFIDDIISDLKLSFKLIVLPRNNDQKKYYQGSKFRGIIIPDKTVHLYEVIKSCDLFIGAGGTMTRETAILGVPTISIYQDHLLAVDRFLISRGNMIHEKNLSTDMVKNYLQQTEHSGPDNELLQKGRDAYELVKAKVLNFLTEIEQNWTDTDLC
jgi:predicted glycosyltransferase